MATTIVDELSAWVSHYLCLFLSLVLIIARLILRRKQQQTFTSGDYWCITAGFSILIRLVAHHYVLSYGSTRIEREKFESVYKLHLQGNPGGAERVMLGSKMVLFTRTLLVFILWSAKIAVLDLLASLIMRLPFEKRILYTYWAILATTFVASIVTVFTSCVPLRLSWEIYPWPDERGHYRLPDKCVIAALWIYTYEMSNIFTDVMLMALSFSIIYTVRIPLSQKARILSLFNIGFVLVGISIARMVRGRASTTEGGQTTYESMEILFSTIVAVTPTLYTLLKSKAEKSPSNMESTVRVPSLAGSTYELENALSHEDDSSTAGMFVHVRNQDWGTGKSAPKI
ncbi:hypothetical protein HBH70_223460 [Parastagonospora nodorum]|nr:hypothetical protein HBH52_214150 [Parastagonospora nodorum]KAH4042818.1 hypothetical protein HBH49_243150 [Parastagonospora nodorum]KAH4084015.1 hypothetical protein HBH46_215690 [Parastagonospora nodorum]KAH4153739.1 hypothetical protein HBH43_223370 [Parastagonospora nodorum]KAH4187713.1 hypothetical protein HBI95_233730 [Parastagonospora nodorum]